jgi:hypothetical protein
LHVLAKLSLAVHDQRIVMIGLLPGVAFVADEPFAVAEDHEMVGIRMRVAAAGIVREIVSAGVADGRATLEDHQRFVARPNAAQHPHALVCRSTDSVYVPTGRLGME